MYTRTKLWTIQPVHPNKFMCVVVLLPILTPTSDIIRCSPSSALSPDEKHIAISNALDGVDIYPLFPDSRPIRHYHYTPAPSMNKNLSMSLSFIHHGRALVCGSPRGSVSIWDEVTEELLQTLAHEGIKPSLSPKLFSFR